jgi:hypothetical protein
MCRTAWPPPPPASWSSSIAEPRRAPPPWRPPSPDGPHQGQRWKGCGGATISCCASPNRSSQQVFRPILHQSCFGMAFGTASPKTAPQAAGEVVPNTGSLFLLASWCRHQKWCCCRPRDLTTAMIEVAMRRTRVWCDGRSHSACSPSLLCYVSC